jgi:uncharacterized membrane protein
MESIDKTIEIEAAVSDVYARWSRFESFPEFMEGIEEVRQLDEKHLHWVMQMAGKKKEWDSEITEHIPDQRISWRSTQGALTFGTVSFTSKDHQHTLLRLQMQYELESAAEKAADALGLVSRRIESNLERFRAMMENRSRQSGSERSQNAEPTLVRGYGTSGKSGLS